MTLVKDLEKELQSYIRPEKTKILQGFFKTADGQYGSGDVFIGVTVPDTRKVAKKFAQLSLDDIQTLLYSQIHEQRLVALIILCEQFKKDPKKRKEIYDFYMKHIKRVNNWDLVDLSADKIVGGYLLSVIASEAFTQSSNEGKQSIPKKKIATNFSSSLNDKLGVLDKLAKSENIWERRIAIIATFQFIKERKEYETTFRIADVLLYDSQDLIQKAVGWMLREVEKRCGQAIEEEFLKTRYKKMPRTMLRYAIEHFPENERQKYLKGEI